MKAQVEFHKSGEIKSLTFNADQGDIANLLIEDGHAYSNTIEHIMEELDNYYFEDVTFNQVENTITLNMIKV